MNFDHRIDWDNIEILKSESHAYRRRVAKSVLINQKARSLNVINCDNGANFSLFIGCLQSINEVLTTFYTIYMCPSFVLWCNNVFVVR